MKQTQTSVRSLAFPPAAASSAEAGFDAIPMLCNAFLSGIVRNNLHRADSRTILVEAKEVHKRLRNCVSEWD